MNQPFMQFNQESGEKAGGSGALSEGGAYVCEILKAEYTQAKTGTHGIEFAVKTEAGQKAQFIKVHYAKSDNSMVNSGKNILNAMMGLLNIPTLSFAEITRDGGSANRVPELEGKKIGLLLQKKLFTKNDGKDGYSFDIRVPFCPNTSRTLKEVNGNNEAKVIEIFSSSYKDNDERTPDPANNYGGFQPSGPDVGDGQDFNGMNQAQY